MTAPVVPVIGDPAQVQIGWTVANLGNAATGITQWTDRVVLSADVPGVHRVMAGSVADASAAAKVTLAKAQLDSLGIAPPYKIIRIWTDRQLPPSYPDLLETPQHDPVALIIQFHQMEGESRAWAAETGGGIRW